MARSRQGAARGGENALRNDGLQKIMDSYPAKRLSLAVMAILSSSTKAGTRKGSSGDNNTRGVRKDSCRTAFDPQKDYRLYTLNPLRCTDRKNDG
jgi:hypothetical protein